jgi:hypothetical protein
MLVYANTAYVLSDGTQTRANGTGTDASSSLVLSSYTDTYSTISLPSINSGTVTLPTKQIRYLGGTQLNTSATTYTFSACVLGNPSVDRRIIVQIAGANLSRTLVSVTVAGVSATINIQYTAPATNCTQAIATASVPAGSSGDIVVTFSGAQACCNIGWYGVIGLTSDNAYATASSPLTGTGQSGLPSINTLVDGFVLGVGGSSSTGTFSFVGPSNYVVTRDTLLTTNRSMGGCSVYTTSTSMILNVSTTGTDANRGFAMASF